VDGDQDLVERYAWFTGRRSGNPRYTDLFPDDARPAVQGTGA
jgi:hypothetical protein